MSTLDKLDILAKSKKKSKRGSALKLLKRNAVPKKSGGRKDAPKKGGGAKAALMRKIHKDPDIQRLLKKNPRYDIIVVRKVQASVFAKAMVRASQQEEVNLDKEQWWKVAQDVNKDYSRETFDRDWAHFQTMKQKYTNILANTKVSELKKKLEESSYEKLHYALKHKDTQPEVKKHIEKELDNRANRGSKKGHLEK